MGIQDTEDAVGDFTLELLRTGNMLFSLAADLIEATPDDAYPGEDSGRVILEMLTGSIRIGLAEADEADLRRAVELMRGAADGVIDHLRLARELRRTMEGTNGSGRTHG